MLAVKGSGRLGLYASWIGFNPRRFKASQRGWAVLGLCIIFFCHPILKFAVNPRPKLVVLEVAVQCRPPEVCGGRCPRTRICRFSCGCGRSADPPNKHICRRGPSVDIKPRVLFGTSNGSATVPVLSSLRTDPYLDTAVGYVREPVWLCGAVGIVYWIQCNPTLLADAGGPRTWVAITVADADRPRTWCLRTRIIRRREICGSTHLCRPRSSTVFFQKKNLQRCVFPLGLYDHWQGLCVPNLKRHCFDVSLSRNDA